jgi:hypothetical protein
MATRSPSASASSMQWLVSRTARLCLDLPMASHSWRRDTGSRPARGKSRLTVLGLRVRPRATPNPHPHDPMHPAKPRQNPEMHGVRSKPEPHRRHTPSGVMRTGAIFLHLMPGTLMLPGTRSAGHAATHCSQAKPSTGIVLCHPSPTLGLATRAGLVQNDESRVPKEGDADAQPPPHAAAVASCRPTADLRKPDARQGTVHLRVPTHSAIDAFLAFFSGHNSCLF